MKIEIIANQLNNLSKGNFEISELPELRKKYLGKKILPGNIFTKKTIFSGDDNYAFHYGGRDEMQFNVGEEIIKEKKVTRAAICFSLEPSQSLFNPVETLSPFKEKFNKFIQENEEYFNGFEMWYYQNGERSENFKPQAITETVFTRNTFIAIGRIISKPLNKLQENDLMFVLQTFDSLLPVYKFCVLEQPFIIKKEQKITRICYNTEGWSRPSGMLGKSKFKDSYEYKMGFGHEEWLFDFDKLINGSHFGFVQSLSGVPKHVEKNYDLTLYTINSDTGERFWTAIINNVEVINETEKKEIFKEYNDRGWILQMKEELRSIYVHEIVVDGMKVDLDKEINHDSFNIKYKPEDVTLLLKPFNEDDKLLVKADYYKLYDSDSDVIESSYKDIKEQKPNAPPDNPPKKSFRLSSPKIVEYRHIHFRVAKSLYENLIQVHGKKNVYWEYNLPYGARVDVAVNETSNKWTYYEVKSYHDIRISIRDALGQLLEYAHWPEKNNTDEIIIVTQKVKEIELGIKYLNHIKDLFGINVFYQYYDLDNNKLSERY